MGKERENSVTAGVNTLEGSESWKESVMMMMMMRGVRWTERSQGARLIYRQCFQSSRRRSAPSRGQPSLGFVCRQTVLPYLPPCPPPVGSLMADSFQSSSVYFHPWLCSRRIQDVAGGRDHPGSDVETWGRGRLGQPSLSPRRTSHWKRSCSLEQGLRSYS